MPNAKSQLGSNIVREGLCFLMDNYNIADVSFFPLLYTGMKDHLMQSNPGISQQDLLS